MSLLLLLLLLLPILLVLQPCSIVTGAGDILSPIIEEDVCKQVKCGQGICKPTNNNSMVPYECECSPGWKQLVAATSDQSFRFLPCVIPNCTLDYSCSKAPSPVQEREKQGNGSIFNVCQWTDCGGGRCVSTSLITHTCECDAGYHNLLNLTFSPCFKECSLGLDCKDLNIGYIDKPSAPPPSLSANKANYRAEGGGYDRLIYILVVWFWMH